MASRELYPPILDYNQPAFIATMGDNGKGEGFCELTFSLSSLSLIPKANIRHLHIAIIRQESGASVVDKEKCLHNTIILPINGSQLELENNVIRIDGENLINGWEAGTIYKIQMRVDSITQERDRNMGVATWLSIHSSEISEWSTYTVVKAIPQPYIHIPEIGNYRSEDQLEINDNAFDVSIINEDTLFFNGYYFNDDVSESLYSYRVRIFENTAIGSIFDSSLTEEQKNFLITDDFINSTIPTEDSAVRYVTDNNSFNFLSGIILKSDVRYILVVDYETINQYSGRCSIQLQVQAAGGNIPKVFVHTIDTDNTLTESSLVFEEEEGCIGIKVVTADDSNDFQNYCIRRSSAESNFKSWEDIAIVSTSGNTVNELDMVFDYTIESGVWYLYGVQIIATNGLRSALKPMDQPVKRDFEFSYLLGEDNKQLKLKYNNNMGSFARTVIDSKMDPLGSKYPFITRNGVINYRTFPIEGLISFHMDDQHSFITRDNLFLKNTDIHKLYNKDKNQYKSKENYIESHSNALTSKYPSVIGEELGVYDYDGNYDDVTYERFFREKVLDFLYDGKPKLFKSPT